MTIKFINNVGGGFARNMDLPDGMTIGRFFDQQVGGTPSDFNILVDGGPTTSDFPLKDGTVVSISPAKVEGNGR